MSNKTIKITPNFFKVNNNTNNNTKKHKSNKIKELSNIIKPNNVKKQLLQKIKQKQNLNNKYNYNENENIINNDETNFDNEFKKTLHYLEKIIKEKEQKKLTKKNKKHNYNIQQPIEKHIQQPIEKHIQQPIEKHIQQPIEKHIQQPIEKHIQQPIEKHIQQPLQQPIDNNKYSNYLNKEPKYGCLKGGTKLTYKQYNNTIKNKNHKPSINIENIEINKKENSSINYRKKKLENLKKKYQPSLNKDKYKKKELFKKFKKYRLKTIKKTYKVGKNNKTNKVGVLIKNFKTRKNVEKEINDLNKVPLNVVKKYLKSKNLLKVGSDAPEYILRQLYKSTIISGDIYNTNKDYLLHNYFNEKEDNNDY
jgi:hypothetical protein